MSISAKRGGAYSRIVGMSFRRGGVYQAVVGAFIKRSGIYQSILDSFGVASLFAAGENGAWYDPSDLSTLFQDSDGTIPVTAAGQPVGRMLDKSGRGNHLYQITSTARPTYQLDGLGLPYLSFDGVDDRLQTVSAVSFGASDKLAIFAGYAQRTAADGVVIESSANYNSFPGTFLLYASISRTPSAGVKGTLGVGLSGGAVALDSAQTSTVLIDISKSIRSDELAMRQNGAAVTGTYSGSPDAGTGSFSNQTLYIGSRAGASIFANMRFYGLIMRAVLCSPGEIAGAENFIKIKSGVA